MEAYEKTDIFKGLGANPHFKNVNVKDFAVLEDSTQITRELAEVAL